MVEAILVILFLHCARGRPQLVIASRRSELCSGVRLNNCGGCVAQVSVTLSAFTPEQFLIALLFDWESPGGGEGVDDALGVGVDRVDPNVVRVLVSWWKEE